MAHHKVAAVFQTTLNDGNKPKTGTNLAPVGYGKVNFKKMWRS